MPGDLNRCEFIGRLGVKPKCHIAASGVAVARFSIAVNSYWKDRATGERQTATQWVRIIAFRGLAEVCSTLLYRRARVFVAGEFATRRFDMDGDLQVRSEIIARKIQLLDRATRKPEHSTSTAATTSSEHPGPETALTRSQFSSWGAPHPGYRRS